MQLSTEDAQVLLAFISSIVVPFIVSYIKAPQWAGWSKVALALSTATIAGILTVYVTEGFNPARIAIAGVSIFTAAHANYKTWFTGLGLEDVLATAGPLAARARLQDEHIAQIYEGTPRGG